jgi:hypothetical protein
LPTQRSISDRASPDRRHGGLEIPLHLGEKENTMPENETDDLVLAVDRLGAAHDRDEAMPSDPTGTSAGDDGENRDGRF